MIRYTWYIYDSTKYNCKHGSNNLKTKLNLDALTVLDSIDREGSFSAAAKVLYRVPSALTYTINKLESDLGIALFDRSSGKPVLTAAGRDLLQRGRVILQQAVDAEQRLHHLARGWETRLTIAVADIIPLQWLYPMLSEFYATGAITQIRLLTEVYGGCWDALTSARADLVVGAPGEGPQSVAYHQYDMGTIEFVFAVAPGHPLAAVPEPLEADIMRQYRAVSAADTSRQLPPRSSGLLGGQDVLTVPDQEAKLIAQCQGLGVGYLPVHLAQAAISKGLLLNKAVKDSKPGANISLVWRSGQPGAALSWFIKRLSTKQWLDNAIKNNA